MKAAQSCDGRLSFRSGSYFRFVSFLSDFFQILQSGHIKISRALTDLPRHLASPYLEVVATDGGGLSSNVTLILDIVDVNDHAPRFENTQGKEFYIKEV